MCGIYGYFGKVPKEKKNLVYNQMKNMAIETLIRGRHATGFFAANEKNIYTAKQAVPASTFITYPNIKKTIIKNDAYIFVGHNRMASVGKINDDNAHPFSGEHYTLVHNGSMGTASMLKEDLSITNAQIENPDPTDSEVFLRALDVHKEVVPLLEKVIGYSFVIYDHKKDILLFARDEYPMCIFDTRQIFGVRIFGSTKEIFQKALTKTLKYDNTKYDNVSYFQTKPYHLYIANVKTQEVTNEKEYMPLYTPTVKVIRKNEKFTSYTYNDRKWWEDKPPYWPERQPYSRDYN